MNGGLRQLVGPAHEEDNLKRGYAGEICIEADWCLLATIRILKQRLKFDSSIGTIRVMDDEGFINIVERKKDMIISGGFNIFPNEVEEVLNSHPAVQDCAVIGVADEKWGETVNAII